MKKSYEARNGSPRKRIFKKNFGYKAQARRETALENLEKTLELGIKNANEGEKTVLSDKDITRIKNEIKILKEKLNK